VIVVVVVVLWLWGVDDVLLPYQTTWKPPFSKAS
jgi:hypothetical protein